MPKMFNADEIAILTRAVDLYSTIAAQSVDGADAVQNLARKLKHLGYIGQTVAFTYEGERLTGRLQEINEDFDGKTRAHIAAKGYLHFVTPDQILGLA
jgi:hypothetical protein